HRCRKLVRVRCPLVGCLPCGGSPASTNAFCHAGLSFLLAESQRHAQKAWRLAIQSKMSALSYSDLDPAIKAWAADHKLQLFTRYKDYEVRSLTLPGNADGSIDHSLFKFG